MPNQFLMHLQLSRKASKKVQFWSYKMRLIIVVVRGTHKFKMAADDIKMHIFLSSICCLQIFFYAKCNVTGNVIAIVYGWKTRKCICPKRRHCS